VSEEAREGLLEKDGRINSIIALKWNKLSEPWGEGAEQF
jgi:hypothetical protein